MKIILVLLVVTFLNFSSAVFKKYGTPPDHPIVVAQGSQIYVEFPGRHILFGTLIHKPDDLNAPIYLRMFNGVGYTTDVYGLDDIASPKLELIRAFIPIEDGTTLVAILKPYKREIEILRYTSVFVRDRANNYILLAGIVSHGNGTRPPWIPRYNQKYLTQLL